VLTACNKSSHNLPPLTPSSSLSFKAGDSLLTYPVNLVYIQDVDSIHTTLISGEYQDTASKKGSLSLRLIGDTTGRFKGSVLLVTYTDGNGKLYYNTSDTTNYVQVDKFPKTYNGVVVGSFSMRVSGDAGSLLFSNGSFSAIYQK
jgi:hypothetical protein